MRVSLSTNIIAYGLSKYISSNKVMSPIWMIYKKMSEMDKNFMADINFEVFYNTVRKMHENYYNGDEIDEYGNVRLSFGEICPDWITLKNAVILKELDIHIGCTDIAYYNAKYGTPLLPELETNENADSIAITYSINAIEEIFSKIGYKLKMKQMNWSDDIYSGSVKLKSGKVKRAIGFKWYVGNLLLQNALDDFIIDSGYEK